MLKKKGMKVKASWQGVTKTKRPPLWLSSLPGLREQDVGNNAPLLPSSHLTRVPHVHSQPADQSHNPIMLLRKAYQGPDMCM